VSNIGIIRRDLSAICIAGNSLGSSNTRNNNNTMLAKRVLF